VSRPGRSADGASDYLKLRSSGELRAAGRHGDTDLHCRSSLWLRGGWRCGDDYAGRRTLNASSKCAPLVAAHVALGCHDTETTSTLSLIPFSQTVRGSNTEKGKASAA
jgi:hypothetical protein